MKQDNMIANDCQNQGSKTIELEILDEYICYVRKFSCYNARYSHILSNGYFVLMIYEKVDFFIVLAHVENKKKKCLPTLLCTTNNESLSYCLFAAGTSRFM